MPPVLSRPTTPLHIVFAGNPGMGKSFILNSLIGSIKFPSGISCGGGLTQALKTHVDPETRNSYSDTPGMDDVHIREMAATEISNALRRGGKFKLIFVCTLEEGRVRPADLTTVKIVLKAIENVGERTANQYSVIVNKCNDTLMEHLDSVRNREKIRGYFCRMFPLKHIDFFPRISAAEGQPDFLLSDGRKEKYASFVRDAPTIDLPPNSGVTIDVTNFEEIKQKLEQEVAELKKKLDEIEHVRSNEEWNKLYCAAVRGLSEGAAKSAVTHLADGKLPWLEKCLKWLSAASRTEE